MILVFPTASRAPCKTVQWHARHADAECPQCAIRHRCSLGSLSVSSVTPTDRVSVCRPRVRQSEMAVMSQPAHLPPCDFATAPPKCRHDAAISRSWFPLSPLHRRCFLGPIPASAFLPGPCPISGIPIDESPCPSNPGPQSSQPHAVRARFKCWDPPCDPNETCIIVSWNLFPAEYRV